MFVSSAHFIARAYHVKKHARIPTVSQANQLKAAVIRAHRVCEIGTQQECVAAWQEVDVALERMITEDYTAPPKP
jgi:hypothetical protein